MHVCDTHYPVARRDRTCDLCARTIRAGARYARTSMCDGGWSRVSEHLECRAEVLRLLNRDQEWEYPAYALAGAYYSEEDWSPEYAAFRKTLLCPACRDDVRTECEACGGRAWVRHGESFSRCAACDGRGHLACETCGGWDGR